MVIRQICTTLWWEDPNEHREYEVEVVGMVTETTEAFGSDRDGNRGGTERYLEVSDVEMSFLTLDEVVSDAVFSSLEQQANEALLDKWEKVRLTQLTPDPEDDEDGW